MLLLVLLLLFSCSVDPRPLKATLEFLGAGWGGGVVTCQKIVGNNISLCRFGGPLDYSLITLQYSSLENSYLESLGCMEGPLLIKPSAVIVAGEAIEKFEETTQSLKVLEKSVQQTLSYVLVLVDEAIRVNHLIIDIQLLQADFPCILVEENNPIFTVLCPNTSIVRKMHWGHTDFSDWRHFIGFCSENKKHIRIGFNGLMPYIHPDLNIPSIEGIFLKTFIEKYKLSHKWHDAGFSWGPFDKETGQFGGVLGLVSNNKICSVEPIR